MAEIKRRTILFSTGKQIKLFGSSVGIGRTLEIGEAYMPNILGANSSVNVETLSSEIQNPHHLTKDEIMELADLMMAYWLQLKDNIRKYGVESQKIFIRDTTK